MTSLTCRPSQTIIMYKHQVYLHLHWTRCRRMLCQTERCMLCLEHPMHGLYSQLGTIQIRHLAAYMVRRKGSGCLGASQICCSSLCCTKLAFSSNTSLRYCASYVFPQGHRLFYCESTAYAITSVQFLNDYYYTAIGSTVGPSFADPSTTPVERVSTSLIADSTSSRGLSPSPTIIPVRITTTPRKKGLGAGAIAGIGAGIGLVLLAVIAGIIFFACKRKRNRNQVTPAQPAPAAFNNNAPMQQQGYMTTPYQNPSQPNAQYHNSQTTFLNDSKSPYDSTRARTYGQPSPMSSPLLVHGDPINRASTVSPPFSHNSSVLGNTRPLSPNLPMTGGADVNGDNIPDYYKHPTGPISEVDGTGPQPQIYGTAGVPQYAGGGAQELGQAQASSHLPHVHEVPAQQEPKYVPYNPGIATPPPQQYSMQQQYPTRNPQPAQGAPVGQPRPAAPYSGPWEIGS